MDETSSHVLEGVRSERALPLWSKKLGLTGKADLVEFHGETPYPVEYKSGRHKKFKNDYTQLCAQAVCLEEMLGVAVDKGALYWHGSRERQEIAISETMRRQLDDTIVAVRDIIAERHVPPPVNDKRCEDCSLREACLPHVSGNLAKNRRAAKELFERGDW